jgi:hypothetical protein
MIGNGEKSGFHRYGFGKLLMNTAIQYSRTLNPKPLFCFGHITGMDGIEGNTEDKKRDLLNYFSNYGLFAVDDASNGRIRIQADLHNLKLFEGLVLNTFSAIQPLANFHDLER